MKQKFNQDIILACLPPSTELWGEGAEPNHPRIIYLPSLSSLLLGHKIAILADPDETASPTRQEWVPLHFFMDDFFNGRAWALQAATIILSGLAADENSALRSLFVRTVKELAGKFLNIDTKKILSATRVAAYQFGVAGGSLDNINDRHQFQTTIMDYFEQHSTVQQVRSCMAMTCPRDTTTLTSQILKIPGISRCTITSPGEHTTSPGLNVFGKKYSLTNRWSTILSTLGTARASASGPVNMSDLITTIHEFRHVLELCQTGTLSIKQDELLNTIAREGDAAAALAQLEDVINQIHAAVDESQLTRYSSKLHKKYEHWKLVRLFEIYDFLK